MKQDIVFSSKSGLVFNFSEHRHLTASMAAKSLGDIPSQAPTATTPDVQKGVKSSIKKIASWDLDNAFPEKVRALVDSNPKLKKGIDLIATEIIGQGIKTGQYDYATGEQVFVPKMIQLWEDFIRIANLPKNYTFLASKNLAQYGCAFVSVILNKEGTAISYLKTQPAHTVRLEAQNKIGVIEAAYIAFDWSDNPKLDNKLLVRRLPLINTEFLTADSLRELVTNNPNDREFMLFLKYPSDEIIYPKPTWWPVLDWIDVSNNVARFKKWLFKNMTAFSHIVYVPTWYWELKYADWKDLISKHQDGNIDATNTINQRRTDFVSQINELVTGVENTSKLHLADIVSDYIVKAGDISSGKSIIIEPVPHQSWSAEFNPDGQEADNQINWALGVDASRYGSQPGTSRQGGSDKSQAHNIGQLNNYIFEELLLEPLRLIRDFNGIDPNIQFQFRRSTIATLDTVSPNQRQLQPAI